MTPEQLALVTVLAGAVVQAIKVLWIGLLGKPKPPREVFAGLAFVVSVALAYVYNGPIALPDPAADLGAYAVALVTAAGTIFGFAYAFYVALLERILAGLDTVAARLGLWKRKLLAP